MENRTLRMTIPQWQGGINPDYVFGAELLEKIAPQSANPQESVTIAVARDFSSPLQEIDGVSGGDQLIKQMSEEWKVLNEKNPTKIIVFGGDCAVTQVPFDYLSGIYGDKLGMIWLDAHPDISDTKTSSHLHEMVCANLLGQNMSSPVTKVKNPISPKRMIYAGLIEEDLRPMDMACETLGIKILSPEKLAEDNFELISWIKVEKIEYICVHWDLDVLTPEDFRSIYPAEPHTRISDFPAAVGRMSIENVAKTIKTASEAAELVGISITEHLPWDSFRLRKIMQNISIFNA